MLPQVDKYELPLSRKGRCACISSGSRRRFGPMQAKERQPVMFGSTLTLCSRYRADFESIRCRYAWDVQHVDAKSIRSAREFSTSLSYRIESTLIRIIVMLLILQCIEFGEGFRARESFSSSKTPGLRLGWGSVHVSPVLDWDLALHYSLPLFPPTISFLMRSYEKRNLYKGNSGMARSRSTDCLLPTRSTCSLLPPLHYYRFCDGKPGSLPSYPVVDFPCDASGGGVVITKRHEAPSHWWVLWHQRVSQRLEFRGCHACCENGTFTCEQGPLYPSRLHPSTGLEGLTGEYSCNNRAITWWQMRPTYCLVCTVAD